jgi:hypothetical protein
MALDGVAERRESVPTCWLYRCADRSPFAYAHGEEFIRYVDHARWARLSGDQLLSMRSGARLAYRVGNVYFDAVSHEPLYYVPSSFALPEHSPVRGDKCDAGSARREPAPHRRTVAHPSLATRWSGATGAHWIASSVREGRSTWLTTM